jgi:hypothetical protein
MKTEHKVPLVIYHADCADGFGAAWVIWSLFSHWEFMEGRYGMQLPDVRDRVVYMVDFSFKRPELYELARSATSIIIIDHHESAIRELAMPFTGDNICPIHTSLSLEHSGAILTWRWFLPGVEPPELLLYIEDRDLWRKKLPGCDEVAFALRQYPQDVALWGKLMDEGVTRLITEGGPILRYYQRQVDNQIEEWCRTPTYIGIGQAVGPCLNSTMEYASELAQGLADQWDAEYEGAGFGVVFQHRGESHIKYSLRSNTPDGANVSEIAEMIGGGGHRHSAGFTIQRLLPMGPLEMFLKIETGELHHG